MVSTNPKSKIFINKAFGYWKVTVDQSLQLRGQLTLKPIEPLRFNSGEEDIRAVLYEEFGDNMFTKFAKVATKLEAWFVDWGSYDAEGDDEEGDSTKKALPERRMLMDPKTWEEMT